MKKIIVPIAICSVFFFACKNSNDSAGTTTESTSDTAAMIEAPIISTAPVEVQSTDSSALVSPVAAGAIPGQPAAAVQGQPVAVAAGMNPAHGQPGHRCDIAVGASLSSPPAKPNAAAAPSTAVKMPTSTVTPAATAAPVVTAPGMNPPHGQPGHDCKIAVGAPLK